MFLRKVHLFFYIDSMVNFQNIERIFDNAPIGIFETTIDGKFVDLNLEFVKILGYESKNDVFANINKLEYDLYADSETRKEILNSIAEKDELSVFEVKFKQKDGSFIDVRMSIRNHFNEQMNQINNIGIIEDITEFKKVEEKRKVQEKRYKTLFENSTDAILIIENLNIIEWNEKARELFCQECRDEKIPKFEQLHPEVQPDKSLSKEKARYLINKTLDDQPQFFEWLLKNLKGETFFAEVNLSPLDQNRRIIQAIVRDITERKHAEQQIRESEYKYRKIVETAPDGIITINGNGTILDVNNSFCKLTGYPREQYLKKNYEVFTRLTDESKKKSLDVFNALASNKTVDPIEIQWMHKSGELRTGEARAISFYDQNHDFVMQVNLRDITAQKSATQTIIKREALLNSIFNSIPIELWVADKNKKILTQSGYSKKKWGDYTGKNIAEFPPAKDQKQYEESLYKVNNGQIVEFNVAINVKDKIKYFKRVLAPYYENNSLKGHLAFSFDISEMKLMQKELEKHKDNLESLVNSRTKEIQTLNEKLIDSNEKLEFQRDELKKALLELRKTQNKLIHTEKMASLGILTAGIAHEINNPTNFINSGILGLQTVLSDLLADLNETLKDQEELAEKVNIETFSQKISELIEAIKTGIDRITKIVKGLRTFSRMDSEEKSLFDVEETITSSLIILQNKFKYKIEINKRFAKNNKIYGFPGKMGQVILNLIMNAIQAILDKGTISITTQRDEQKNQYKIIVEDDGIGMNEATRQKIFDPFFTTKNPGEGTGIGMSIVHTIIEEHKGKIFVNSELGRGSTFTIQLPIK